MSIVCKAGTSTRNSECSGLKGMLGGVGRVESESVAGCRMWRDGWCFGVFADQRLLSLGWRWVIVLLRQREDRAMIGDISGGEEVVVGSSSGEE